MIASTLAKSKNALKKLFVFKSAISRNMFWCIILIVVLSGLMIANFFIVDVGGHAPGKVLEVLSDPSRLERSATLPTEAELGMTAQEWREIQLGVWTSLSTIVASVGLALSGLVTQALTRNPLADTSTLGLMQGGVFALVAALAIGWSEYYLRYIAILIGIGIAVAIMAGVFFIARSRLTATRVILIGLALGIIFRTFTFLVRSGDKFLTAESFIYTLGGAETVNKGIGANQWEILYISSALIAVSGVIFAFIARPLSIIDLGDAHARQLGVPVRTVKFISLIVLLLGVPAAVILVGNLAFVGLFGTHLARYFFKTRSYWVTFFPAMLIGSILTSTGLMLHNVLPAINSGIFTVVVGAPYLIYAGMRGLK